jgi:Acetyltransferase (GNAT) domain
MGGDGRGERSVMNPLIEARHDRAQGPETMSTWSLLCNGPDTASVSLRQSWRDLLAASGDPFAMHQSPEWFEVNRAEAAAAGLPAPSLAVRRNSRQEVVGVVPLHSIHERLVFPLALRRSILTRPKHMIRIPSGRLLLPEGDRWLDGLFSSLGRCGPERPIIRLSNVPVPGPLSTYVGTSPLIRRDYCVYTVPPSPFKVYTIPLPPTYDEFLARYSSKKRYNLRRQLRQLVQHAAGGLTLRRFESPDDVPELLACWDQLSAARETPDPTPVPVEGREVRNRRLAGVGLLCSYVLMDGARPIAGFLGYRCGSVFTVGKTLHDHSYNAYSPGTCLLHMVIEQLVSGGSARLISFGYGYPGQEWATHAVLDYVSYWLVPATWRSRLFQFAYGRLRRGIAAVKSGLPQRNAVPGEHADDAQG